MCLSYVCLFLVSLLAICHGQCRFNETSLRIANGYISNAANIYNTTINLGINIAYGYLEYACAPGYTLNPSIGSRLTCDSTGSWSALPACQYVDRCPTAALFDFIQNTSIATTMTFNGNYSLPMDGVNNSSVISGAFVAMICGNGYVNIGGPLNITCVNGSWTPFPNCVLNSGGGPVTTTTTPMAPNIGLPCSVNSTTAALVNGYVRNMSYPLLPLVTTFYGSIEFGCEPGYILDPAIGGLYTCNNGTWSTKPLCLRTGRCSVSTLTILLSSTTALQSTGQTKLIQTPDESTDVLNGSYAVFSCMSDYTNIGGSLNVTCNADGSWTPLPNCVLNSGGGTMTTTTTTMAPSIGSSCPVNSTSLSLAHGFIIDTTAPVLELDTTFSGWVLYRCSPGYTLDPAIGGLYTCNNGTWSTKPRCLKTGRCSLSNLTTLLSTTTGIQSTGQTKLIQNPDEPTVLINGSYAVFSCMSGYTNIGGNLNVTCNTDGSWTPLPNCIMDTKTITTPSTGGSSCLYSSSLLTITNGYASNWNGVMISSPDQALLGSFIDYTCMPSYTLMGNSRMTCTNGVWSAQPGCIASGPGGMTTTTSTTTILSPLGCVGIPSVANAYISNTTLVDYGNNNYQGQVHFTCRPGYAHVGTSGSRWVSCTNGVWDALPACTESPVCSIPELQAALVNVALVSHSLSAGPRGALAGGWIQLQCASGFTLNPFSGSLNVTCQSTGRWTQFPVCSR